MKLSKEEIKFIDTYLISDEVIFVDIRQEMLDHIATAVEEKMTTEQLDFYEAFKIYMIHNKKEVMKNNKEPNSYSWVVIRQFLLFLVKPYMLALVVLLFFFFKNVDVNPFLSKHFSIAHMFFFLMMLLALFQIIYFYVYLKKRFYAIERSGSVLTGIYFFQLFFLPISENERVSEFTLTIFTFLYLSFVAFYLSEMVKFHKHRFNYI